MDEESTGTGWWRTLPGVLTATAAVVTAVGGLIVALQQAGFFRDEDPEPPRVESVAESPASPAEPAPGATAPAAPGDGSARAGSVTARPLESEVRVGPLVYRLLSAEVERYSDDSLSLDLLFRFTNVEIEWGVNVGPANFRLLVDDVPLAPREAYIDVIDFQSAEEGRVVFTLPSGAERALLQLGVVGREVSTIPIELSASP